MSSPTGSTHRGPLPFAVALLVTLVSVAGAAPVAHLGQRSYVPSAADDPVVPLPAEVMLARAARAAGAEGLAQTALYPFYAWPMQHALGDGLFCANYVDQDSTAGFLDYQGGAWTYDTHRGTDISLYDFKAMDRGYRIVAAAPGMVTTTVYANLRDRNCAVPDNPTLNYIEVANGDGTYTYYYHLRANSMTVNLGETIQTGQMLGMAGSSGYAFGPHLHFEAADWLSGPYRARDPWAGPANPNPGRWISQPPYAGTQPFTVLDMGVMTQPAAGGDIFNVDYCGTILERVQEPATVSTSEPYLAIWFYPVAHTGQSYTLDIVQPDNTLYDELNYTFTADQRGGYQYWIYYWNPYATQTGTWKARMKVGATVVAEHPFTVGAAATLYPPRFVKGGRSFRLDGVTTQRDTLHLRALGSAGVTLALKDAPSWVSLHDSTVTVGTLSDQPFRSRYFEVIATNTAGLRDTAWYHVVDPGKPLDPTVSVDAAPGAPERLDASAGPVPFHGAAAIRFVAPTRGAARIEVFDPAGRRVRLLLDRADAPAGEMRVNWDGRDDAGRVAPPGVYLCRVAAGGERRVLRLVSLR